MRAGFDIGGAKIAAIALDEDGAELKRCRAKVPRDYDATVRVLGEIVTQLEGGRERAASVGISLPGMISGAGEVVRIANLPWLRGRPFAADLEAALDRPVRIANDANCFALSEATDGAAAGARMVFGVILGTGVGGGIVLDGRLYAGANAVAGEWGHNPLPGYDGSEGRAVQCGCGRTGCIETWLNGAAIARDYRAASGREAEASGVARLADDGDAEARAVLTRYEGRLARALAGVINVLDPDVIVLGGGLSEIPSLYANVPRLWRDYTVAPEPCTCLVRAAHGPASGMRGAAWL